MTISPNIPLAELGLTTPHQGAAPDMPFVEVEAPFVDPVTYARQIQAEVYLREGYVQQEDIDQDGLIVPEVDPYVDRSTYFISELGGRTAVSRQILAAKKEGLISLPVFQEFECDPEVVKATAGVNKLGAIKSNQVVEISALAATEGAASDGANLGSVIDLYVKMLKHSVEQNHKLWVMGTDHRLTRKLRHLVNGQLKSMGESKFYMGSKTDPVCLNPQEVVKSFMQATDGGKQVYRQVLIEGLQGADASKMSREMVQVLKDNGVELQEPSRLRSLWERRKPEMIAAAGLLGYTALRALPVAQIDEFHGNPAVFLAIDAGTAVPYAAGLGAMYRGENSTAKKAAGAVTASASFAAPYAYLWANGEQYPTYVNAAIGGFVAGSIAKEVIQRRLQLRKEQKIENQLLDK